MKLRYDRRILLLTVAAGFPGIVVALLLLWAAATPRRRSSPSGFAMLVLWALAASSLRHRIVFPLQTMANLLEALRESDFSFRARGARRDDPLGETLFEINALADTLRDERLGSLEATALLRTVMSEIDVAVFAFDDRAQAAAGQSRRRAAARPSRRAIAVADRRRHQPGRVPRRHRAARVEHRVSRRQRPMAGAPRIVPAGRAAAHAGRVERRQRAAAAAGARGVASPDSRARPRAEQLARADQVDRRQPREHRGAGSDARRLARGHAPRPRHHRRAHRRAQPVHVGLHGARAVAAAEHARGRFVGARRARRAARDAQDHSGRSPARRSPCRPIPISSSSC